MRRLNGVRHQRGDTIVEVLISIAVVALVLAGAFIATNRSLQATRSAQERVNALKLGESQIEQIKGLAATDSAALFGPSAPQFFCIPKATGLPAQAATSASGPVTNADCRVGLSGDPTDDQPRFDILISRAGYYFVLNIEWSDVSGRVTDNVELRYRVYDD